MAELPENRRHSTSSSSSSSDLSVRVERELGAGNGSTSKDLEDSTDAVANGVSGSSSSTASGIPSRGLSKVTTLPVDISHHSHGDKLESSSNKFKLERSKTERQRHLRPEDAAQIFDDKLPVLEKLKLLNRIATVKDDGTVEFEVPVDAEPEAFGARSKHVNNVTDDSHGVTDLDNIPLLSVVMLIVGTRGDVQPFVAIGKRLQDYGHRVRLATHSNFKEFVLTAGLEFYPLGGDPKVLAGYMVKNKGVLPSGPSEIPVQRNQMKEIINSLLPACKEPDTDSGVPFKADAIIANPPAYGHTHVAEALQIPIHIFFTMPWTPTTEFPHPLSHVKQQSDYRLSYQIVDSLIWPGIRDMINDLRKKKLKLRPVTYLSGSQGSETDIPHAYIWSPHLVPKPKDWGPKIDVVGFCFLDLASNYEPPESLVKWLEEGDEPIYIGFGSLPVQEPKKMTQTIVEALETTGQRGIINKGWGGLGELTEPKDSIYLLDNVPHDWLFLHCKAVVHHGGAGTTAVGLKAACPTTIVPFFGDQPFWGERVHDRGVGPPPIPVDEFSLPKLIDAIKFMLDPKVKERAVELAKAMENEDGVTGAVKAFFKQLPQKKPELDTEPSPSSIFSIGAINCLFGERRLLSNMSSESNPIVGDEVDESQVVSCKRTRTSIAWDTFDKIVGEDGLPKARCKICGKVYMARDTGGTSNIRNHAMKCGERSEISSHPPLDQLKFREKISEVIIKHDYPFSFVEHEGIRDTFCFLHPHAKTMTRNTAKADIVKLYKKEKESLKCYLRSIPGRICLTSDLWSSITTDQYMVLTAHYITENWELHKKVLAFCHLPPPHNGVNLAEKLLSLLKEWGIDKKIFTISLDNASYNDAMVNILKRQPTFGPGLIAKGEHFHVRCGAHILNLIVHAGLKIIDNCLVKIRESVKYIRGSEARKIKFASCLEQLSNLTSKQVRQDVPTRWNSTYLMLESTIGFKEAFTLLKNMDTNFDSCLSEEEWVEVEKIAEFLKPFYDITTLFSGTCYPTANLYFQSVWRIQCKLKEAACVFHDEFDDANQFCCMAKKMKEKFDKYWKSYNIILSFAVILDPRYKLQLVEYCYVKLYGREDGVTLAKMVYDKLQAFFLEYVNSCSDEANLSQRSVRGSPNIASSTGLEDFGAFESILCGSSRKESDLLAYLKEQKLDHKKHADLDVLEYWKTNEGKYPELSLMARDVLSIPITTVASESAFSIGGRILNKYRSSLLPENVEALLCTRDWLCGTPAALDLDGKDLVEDFSAFSISETS